MVAKSYTVAFEGIQAHEIEVQCAISPGVPAFSIVGLPNKAVNEAKERVRSALQALSIALPSKRIVINLSPADMPKEGSHYDLPIALALLGALDVIAQDEIEGIVALGELSLDGTLIGVCGALPAALMAGANGRKLVCPSACGAEAAWVDKTHVISCDTLIQTIQHFTGKTVIPPAQPGEMLLQSYTGDMAQIKGQERAKRALEIAAAGRHHTFLTGVPGAGKSMMAARLPSILPPLSASEVLQTSMIHSLSGLIDAGGLNRARPFRDPHHTASVAAICGGGRDAKPGEVSLAHNGVLFMDEFPEFPRSVLETLRQPIETGSIMVARANAHVRYPCRFLLIAAANLCKCGYISVPHRACTRAPKCSQDYLGRISGPLMDRFDLRIDVPAIALEDLDNSATGETSATIAQRVSTARQIQLDRYKNHSDVHVNADVGSDVLHDIALLGDAEKAMLHKAADQFGLSARGYYRILRVARTIADLEQSETVGRAHVAEALSYRIAA